jgi:hypothetical protein
VLSTLQDEEKTIQLRERAHTRMSRREHFSRRRKWRQQINILWYSVIINLRRRQKHSYTIIFTGKTPCFIGLGLLAYFTSLFTDMYGSLIHTIFVVDFPRWRRFLTRWFCDRIHSVTCKNLYMTYFPVNIIVYECFWRRLRLIKLTIHTCQ